MDNLCQVGKTNIASLLNCSIAGMFLYSNVTIEHSRVVCYNCFQRGKSKTQDSKNKTQKKARIYVQNENQKWETYIATKKEKGEKTAYRLMLKKSYRLHVGQAYSFTDSLNTPYFLVKIAKNNLLHSRYGFVISKKVDKRAVARNSMRRKLQACLQANAKKIVPGFDMLFIVKSKVKTDQSSAMCGTLLEALQKKGYTQ